MAKQVHVIRTTDIHRGTPMWIVFDADGHRLNGKPRQSKDNLVNRWIAKHGIPDKIITYDGPMRPSVAAMTIASVQEGRA